MNFNVSSFTSFPASCSNFMDLPSAPEWQEVHAEHQALLEHAAYQNFSGIWDDEKKMMFFKVPGNIVSTSASIEVNGCTYYTQPELDHRSLNGSVSDGCDSSDEEWNIENRQHLCFPPTIASESVELDGTTYYWPATQNLFQEDFSVEHRMEASAPIEVNGTVYYCLPSGSSCSGSEREASPPDFDEYASIQEVLKSLVLTEEEMKQAGYPVMDEIGEVQMQPTHWETSKTWIEEREPTRECSRCHEEFAVDAQGRFPTGPGICQYTTRSQWKTAENHISTQRFISELGKFVATPVPDGDYDERSDKVYAMDAEMVATTAGFALARLSVVDFDGHLKLDVIVRPEAQVVDYLTEFSGITEDMLNNATHSLDSCRALLFELINSKTILIGHGLESDLKALRLVHRNVIDSSILYLDARNRKVALRKLAKEHLGRTIQADNSNTFGHCSEEDALASLDLVKHRAFSG